MARKTRKISKKKLSTIPELKRSFDHLDAETQKILVAPGSPLEKVKRFQKVWMNIFHKTVTKEAAEAYLAIKRKKRGRTRKQHGGMASLDYTLRPGIDGPYGHFPAYVQSGFSVGYPMPGISESCGVTNSGPQISASLGTNQAGGNAPIAQAFAALSMGQSLPSSVPPSVFQDIQSKMNGQPLGPPSDPVTNKPPYI